MTIYFGGALICIFFIICSFVFYARILEAVVTGFPVFFISRSLSAVMDVAYAFNFIFFDISAW